MAADGPLETGRVRAGVEELRTDIRFIQLGSPALVLANRTLFAHPLFWVTLLVPLAAVGGAAGLRRHRDRLHGDVAYARSRRAAKVRGSASRKRASWPTGRTCAPSTPKPGTRSRASWPTS